MRTHGHLRVTAEVLLKTCEYHWPFRGKTVLT